METLSADEADEWTNRLLGVLGKGVPEVPSEMRGRATAKLIDLSGTASPSELSKPEIAQLLRLVSVPGADTATAFGGHIQVLGVELYDTRVTVTWRLAPPPDPEARFSEELAAHDRDAEGLPENERHLLRQHLLGQLEQLGQHQVELGDDIGTAYQRSGGNVSGSPQERVGRTNSYQRCPSGWANSQSIALALDSKFPFESSQPVQS